MQARVDSRSYRSMCERLPIGIVVNIARINATEKRLRSLRAPTPAMCSGVKKWDKHKGIVLENRAARDRRMTSIRSYIDEIDFAHSAASGLTRTR